MENKTLLELTAPCGLDCFNCPLYLADKNEAARKLVESMAQKYGFSVEKAMCPGCRKREGIPPLGTEPGLMAEEPCKVFKCVSLKGIESCADCSEFPCDNLHPYAELASDLPHNIKVFNLALMRKMGKEKWAKEKAKSVRDTYFCGKFNL